MISDDFPVQAGDFEVQKPLPSLKLTACPLKKLLVGSDDFFLLGQQKA